MKDKIVEFVSKVLTDCDFKKGCLYIKCKHNKYCGLIDNCGENEVEAFAEALAKFLEESERKKCIVIVATGCATTAGCSK